MLSMLPIRFLMEVGQSKINNRDVGRNYLQQLFFVDVVCTNKVYGNFMR